MIDQALEVLSWGDWLTLLISLGSQAAGRTAIMTLPDDYLNYMQALQDAGYTIRRPRLFQGFVIWDIPRDQFEDAVDQLQAWGLDIEVTT